MFHARFQTQELKMLKSLFKLFATLEKKKRVLLKQRWDCISKWKQRLLSPNHQMKKSMLQAIKRVHYQVYYYSRVDEAIKSGILLQDNGWILLSTNEGVRSLWFTGTFLISFLHFHSSRQI